MPLEVVQVQGRKLLVLIVTLFISYSALLLHSQQLNAVLNGTVTDPSGAVVPDATITVTQEEGTTAPRTVKTSAQGAYSLSDLPAGNYNVTVAAPGFQKFQATNVTLYVAQTRTVNAKLTTGTVSQTVTVQQNAVALNTTTSELSGTISGTQVTQLQLNNRNFEQLVTLQPGVVSALPDEVGFGLNNTSSVAVNGARDTANNWSVDGADINDSGSNATLLNVPSVDAIQEFTLERSTYDAGFGRSGAGQILVATKSGTSHFHGDAYEFNRNDIFNANSYFNNQYNLPRAIERYNDFGFTIGGPVIVPKAYTDRNKLFFFWSEEWRKVTSPNTVTLNAPTSANLGGSFSGPITDAPAGCVAYNAATNTSTVSPTCYSQNAKVYLANVYDKFPANGAGTYTFSYSSLNNTREDLVRIDANLTNKLHFFARAMQDETPENFPQGLFAGSNFPNIAGSTVNAPGQNVVGNLTWTLSPKLVNEAEFAYSQGTISSSFTPGSIATSPSIASQLTNNTAYKDPYGRIPGISFVGGAIQGFAYGSTPYFERNLDRTLFDNLTANLGRHVLRTGVTVSQMLKTENASSGEANFEFSNFSDFLLGNVYSYTQASRDTVPDLHYFNFEAYVQDDWQITSRLTLNLGLRYSYFPSPGDVLNTLNNFDPQLYNSAAAPAIDPVSGNFVAGGQVPATYVNGLIFPKGSACTQAAAIAPGIQCSPWGAHVNPDPKDDFAPRLGFAWAPFENGRTAVHGGYGIFYDRSLNGIWEQNAFQDPPLVQVATINNTQFDHPLAGTSSVSLSPNHIVSTGTPGMPTESYMDFNLSVQQQLRPDTVAEIAYVGSLGRHLLGERDLNQPTLGERAANPTAWVTAVVPYRGYSWFASRIPEYSSNYHSLQASLNHRVANGLTLGIAYTWSKTLTNQSNDRDTETYDTYNPHLDYGPASLNQPQTFVANYVYDLPFYQHQNGFVGHTLGGWELSGITEFASGQSFSALQEADNFDCRTPAGATTGCVAGTYPGGINIDPSDIAPRPDVVASIHKPKTQTQWFSTGSFANAVGHFGDASNGILLGPGIELWDLSSIKNFNLGDRAKLQLRGEFFNAFNHTNFDAVGQRLGTSTFGQVTSTHDPREIQLGGKITF
ncbi:MAG TPA: TonB-dependent receptor [Acidobacteriaceae bacterium]|nr:TonB-dependent receptor [Acidobacteriaceae bacterium]